MTLQTLLLKLSRNKDIFVECIASDDKLKITIQEMYTFDKLLEVELNLNEKIDASKFKHYL